MSSTVTVTVTVTGTVTVTVTVTVTDVQHINALMTDANVILFFFQLRKEGLNVSYSQSSIYLPSQAFYARDSRVVSLVYLTLNDVLSLDKDDDDDQILSPNTTVVSSTVFPRPPDVLNKPPVKIILQNRRVSQLISFLI